MFLSYPSPPGLLQTSLRFPQVFFFVSSLSFGPIPFTLVGNSVGQVHTISRQTAAKADMASTNDEEWQKDSRGPSPVLDSRPATRLVNRSENRLTIANIDETSKYKAVRFAF
jgi:hypothetical protein